MADIFDSLDSMSGQAGEDARTDAAAAPVAFETPQDTTSRLYSQAVGADSQARTYGRMKAKDLANRGIPSFTNPQGNTSPITDETGQSLSNADPRNAIAYDSSGKPVSYRDKDPTTGKPTLADPYEGAPQQQDKLGNIYTTPKGLPWRWEGQDTAVAEANAQKTQDQIVQQSNSALAPYEQQAKVQLGQANKALSQSVKSTQQAFTATGAQLSGPDGEPIDLKQVDGPTLKGALEDSFNREYSSPQANEAPWFGSGKYSQTAQAYRDDIDRRKQAAMNAADAHITTVGNVQTASDNLDQIQSQRSALNATKLDTINQKRESAGLQPLTIPGIDNSDPAASAASSAVGSEAPTSQGAPAAIPGLEDASIDLNPPHPVAQQVAATMPAAGQQALQPTKTDADGKVQPEGFWQTAGRAFGTKIIPALGTAAGGLGAGTLAIESGPGAIAADVAGGIAGGAVASKIQRTIMGDQWANSNEKQLDANEKEHPVAAQIGTIVPFLVSMLGGQGWGTAGKTITSAGKAAVNEALQLGEKTVVPAIERILRSATMQARASGGAAAEQDIVEGKDQNVLDATAKGAFTGGALGLFPAAKTILGQVVGKGVTDGAAMALAGGIYDAAIHGQKLDFEKIAQQAGGNIPAFVLQNAVLSFLTHGIGAKSGAPTEQAQPTSEAGGGTGGPSPIPGVPGVSPENAQDIATTGAAAAKMAEGHPDAKALVADLMNKETLPKLADQRQAQIDELPEGAHDKEAADSESKSLEALSENLRNKLKEPSASGEAESPTQEPVTAEGAQQPETQGKPVGVETTEPPAATPEEMLKEPTDLDKLLTNSDATPNEIQGGIDEATKALESAPEPQKQSIRDKISQLTARLSPAAPAPATATNISSQAAGSDDPKKIAKDAGVEYQGESMGLHAFKDPETNGNFSIAPANLSPEAVKAALDKMREAFNAGPIPGVGQASESDIDAAIAKAHADNAAAKALKAQQEAKSLPKPNASDWQKRGKFVGEDFAGPPNSVVIQVRDLDSVPIGSGKPTVLPLGSSMDETAKSVHSGYAKLVNSKGGSMRESLVKVLDANGKAIAQMSWTPEGMEVAEQGAFDKARKKLKEAKSHEPTTATQEQPEGTKGAPQPSGEDELRPGDGGVDEEQRQQADSGKFTEKEIRDEIRGRTRKLRTSDENHPDHDLMEVPPGALRESDSGFSAGRDEKAGRMVVNYHPETLADSADIVTKNWVDRNLPEKDAKKQAKRWLRAAHDEELIHVHQLVTSGKGHAAFYDKMWREQIPEPVREAYEKVRRWKGDQAETASQKAAEFERMVIQFRKTGTISEALYGSETAEKRFEELKPFLGRQTPAIEANIARVMAKGSQAREEEASKESAPPKEEPKSETPSTKTERGPPEGGEPKPNKEIDPSKIAAAIERNKKAKASYEKLVKSHGGAGYLASNTRSGSRESQVYREYTDASSGVRKAIEESGIKVPPTWGDFVSRNRELQDFNELQSVDDLGRALSDSWASLNRNRSLEKISGLTTSGSFIPKVDERDAGRASNSIYAKYKKNGLSEFIKIQEKYEEAKKEDEKIHRARFPENYPEDKIIHAAKPEFYREMAEDVREDDSQQKATKPSEEQIEAIAQSYRELASKSDFPAVRIADVMEGAGYDEPTMVLGKQHLMWMWNHGMITAIPSLDWSLSTDRVRAWGIHAQPNTVGHDTALAMVMPKSIPGVALHAGKPDTGAPGESDIPSENLTREAEAAGVILKTEELKGLIRSDKTVMNAVRAKIKARTGRDALFASKPEVALEMNNGDVFSLPREKGGMHAQVLLEHNLNPEDVKSSGFIFDGKYKAGNLVRDSKGNVTDVEPMRKPSGWLAEAIKDQPQSKGFEGITNEEKRIVQIARENSLFASKPLSEKLDTIREESGLNSIIDDIQKILSPDDRLTASERKRFQESGDPNAIGDARKTGIFLDGITAAIDRRKKQFEMVLKEARLLVSKLPEKQQVELMQRVDEGTPLKAGPYKDAFDKIAKLDEERTEEAKKWFESHGQEHWANYENYLKNIVPHYFEDQETANKVIDQLLRERKMIGGTGFLKHRADMTMREVIEWAKGKGIELKPKHTNVVDAIADRWTQQERYFGAHEMIQRMVDNGTGHWENADYIPRANERMVNNIVGQRTVVDAEGNRHKQYFYAAEPSATIINNYLSRGLRSDRKWVENYFTAANVLNSAQLGLSAFHGFFVTMEGMASSFAIGVQKVLHGNPAGLKDIATAPVSTWSDWTRGGDIRKTMLDPLHGTDTHRAIVDAMVEGGFRDGIDSFYHDNHIQAFMDAMRGQKVFTGILRAPLALIELVAKPLMEHYVPRMKAAAVYKLAEMHMKKSPGMSAMDLRQRLQEDVRSGNNRFGQMTYDNLHLNKITKDLLMMSTRSLGWNWGSLAEIGGGLADWARFAKNAAKYGARKIRGGNSGGGGDIPEGPDDSGTPREYQPGGAKFPRITNRMAYVLALPIIVGLFGAVLAAMFGQRITRPKDLYFVKTGEVDDHGNPVRVVVPSYMKDLFAWSKHPVESLVNKLHPLLSMLGAMMTNRDYYGVEIRHSGDPVMKQILSELGYFAKQFVPFSGRNAGKLANSDVSTPLKIATGTGALLVAPSSSSKTDAEQLASELVREQIPPKARTQEDADHSALVGQLTGLMRIGKGQTLMQQSLAAHKITAKDVANIQRNAALTPLQVSVKRLSYADTLKVESVATPQEEQQLRPMIAAKAAKRPMAYAGF